MWEYRNKVAVAGVGYSPLTRRSPRSLASLTLEALDGAIADAGLTRDQIDGLVTYPDMPRYGGEKGSVDGVDIVSVRLAARMLGIEGTMAYALNTQAGIFGALAEAVYAVAAGACTCALIWRAVHLPRGRYNSYEQQHATGINQFMAPYGFTMPAAWAAIAMQRYMQQTGCTRESFGRFIVQNRQHANQNPRSYFYGKPLTLDDYLGARMIADPCTILDCDIPIDGAAALLLTTTERARDLRHSPALVTAIATARTRPLAGSMSTSSLEDQWDAAADTATQLWAASGLGPAEIGVAQLYDGFSILVYTWLEGMGFCPRGEGFRFIDEGCTALGGELPLSTGGGALGEGRLHGMAQLTEASLQAMGRADVRQVPGVAHSLATFSTGTHGVIFSRDQR